MRNKLKKFKEFYLKFCDIFEIYMYIYVRNLLAVIPKYTFMLSKNRRA